MSDNYLTHIYEAMNALVAANDMPSLDSGSSVYIINYMHNNAFAQALTIDYKMRHGIIRDPEDKKLKFTSVDNQDQYGFDNSTDIKGVYHVMDKAKLSEGLEKIKANIGKDVPEGFIYECVLGDKMYSWDQIDFCDKVEKVVPYDELIKGMNESIRNYTLHGKEKAEVISEIKYGDKNMSTLLSEQGLLLDESKLLFKNHSRSSYNLNENNLNGIDYTILNIPDSRLEKYIGKEKLDFYKGTIKTSMETDYNSPKVLNPKTKKYEYRKVARKYKWGGFRGEYLIDTEKDKVIGYVAIDPRLHEVKIPVINQEYKGKGFMDILVLDAIKKFEGKALKISVNDESKLDIFKKHGFKIVEANESKKNPGYTNYLLRV